MAKAHAKGGVRPNQPETAFSTSFDGSNWVYVASLVGGGLLPPSGEFSLAIWAKLIGKTEEVVRSEFEERNLPYRRFGTTRFYDADLVRRSMPLIHASEDPSHGKHGGNRRKAN